jgi:hypothetical protein
LLRICESSDDIAQSRQRDVNRLGLLQAPTLARSPSDSLRTCQINQQKLASGSFTATDNSVAAAVVCGVQTITVTLFNFQSENSVTSG